MDENSVEIPVYLNIDDKEFEKDFNSIVDAINSQAGKLVNKTSARLIDKTKRQWLALVATSKNTYRAVKFNTDKDDKILEGSAKMVTTSRRLTRKQAELIYSSPTPEALTANARAVNKQQTAKLAKQSRQATEEQKQQANIDKAIEKQQDRERKISLARAFSSIVGETVTPADESRARLTELNAELSELKARFMDLPEASGPEFETLRKQIENVRAEIGRTKKEIQKLDRVTPFQKFFNTIKRVGFYRVARNLFRFIEAGLSDSITSLAQFDKGVNNSLSSITSSFKTLSNSLAIVVYPLLKIAEPVLKSITKLVGDLASAFSYLAYRLGITSEWFEINTDYMKEFNQQSNLLSFDKFEALSENEDASSMFIKHGAGEEISKELSSIASTLQTISITLGVIGGYKLISWVINKGMTLFNNDLNKAFSTLDDGSKKATNGFKSMYNAIKPAYLAIAGISLALDGIVSVINWDETTSGLKKVLDVLKIVFGVVAGIAGIVASFAPAGVAKVAKAIAFSATLAGVATIATEKIAGYANGGIVDSGSLFVAGESGAELVTTMPSGQTGVTNIAQFKQAMLEALYEWGGNGESGGDVVLNLDGAEIARSKRFISEVNRRNSGVYLR